MKKLSSMSTEEVKSELRKRAEYLDKQAKWVHKDRVHKALLNEYGRRVMERII